MIVPGRVDVFGAGAMACRDKLLTGADGFCLADPRKVCVVLVEDTSQAAELNLGVGGGEYAVQWYDPRKGGVLQDGRTMILSVSRRTGASIRRVRNVLGLPRSSFYTAATESPRQAADRELGSRVERLFNDHLGRCGYRRISAELGGWGVACPPGRAHNL
ncbi:MAG: hypothetical protein P8J87_03290, partial [Verrucomicrobiales bacterium]|nr:hypothetical protein [Verrucomicrobiales bacterium]